MHLISSCFYFGYYLTAKNKYEDHSPAMSSRERVRCSRHIVFMLDTGNKRLKSASSINGILEASLTETPLDYLPATRTRGRLTGSQDCVGRRLLLIVAVSFSDRRRRRRRRRASYIIVARRRRNSRRAVSRREPLEIRLFSIGGQYFRFQRRPEVSGPNWRAVTVARCRRALLVDVICASADAHGNLRRPTPLSISLLVSSDDGS